MTGVSNFRPFGCQLSVVRFIELTWPPLANRIFAATLNRQHMRIAIDVVPCRIETFSRPSSRGNRWDLSVPLAATRHRFSPGPHGSSMAPLSELHGLRS